MDREAPRGAAVSERIYLDHAATTPCRPEVVAAMLPLFAENGYNPSSTHAEGRRARAALDDARVRTARLLGARPREIVFTAGGTEANNIALLGAARARRGEGKHVVTVATEHPAVLRTMDALAHEGFAVTVLGVDRDGCVDPAAFAAALRPGTILASVMLANNEVGTIAPVARLAELARERRVLFHTDAVQGPAQLRLDVGALGVDLLSISAHKFYGPKGVGALYVRSGTPLAPALHGGGQEAGLRSGTENVAGIVGLAAALEYAAADLPAAAQRIGRLRDALQSGILARVPHSTAIAAGAERLPGTLSAAFADADAEALLVRLDLDGIASSAGSACHAGAHEPSHVIAALRSVQPGAGIVRFSLGRTTTEEEIDRVLALLPKLVAAVREFPVSVGTS
jgi:cysteine desulfurase